MLFVALAKMSNYYVYIIRSIRNPKKIYKGITNNLERRLLEHNSGHSAFTAKFIPWKIETVIVFSDRNVVHDFELYLKTGSGIAFTRKHLLKSNNFEELWTDS